MIYNKSEKNKMWDTKKLSDLGKFDRGVSKYRPRNDRKLFEGGGYPFIQTSDIKDANLYILKHTQEYGDLGLKQSKLWEAGTLCITIAANIADIAILSYPMCFPDSIVGFIADRKCCSAEFMYYIFTYINSAIRNIASGSTQDNINLEYLTTLEFKIPKKDYQDKIVKILKCIDDKINLNNKINDNLSNQLQTIYDYWFNQFEFPNENGKPYKSSGGKLVYNDILKKEIPYKWSIKQVKEVLKVITGKQDANFSTDNGKYHFFTCSNDILRCDKSAFNGSAVLIAGNGDFNVKHYTGEFNAYQRTYVLIPDDILLYSQLYIQSKKLIDKFKLGAAGSIVKFITKNDIDTINLLIPDNNELLKHLNKYIFAIEKNDSENILLQKYKNFLLPLLINGQATIS